MKKFAIVLVLGLALAGCKFGNTAEEAPVAEIPAVAVDEIVAAPIATEGQIAVTDFYFESSDDGLVLLSTADPAFKQILSDQKILDAELIEGILTFTVEDADGLPNTEVMNLHEYLNYLNSQK